jgi:hypothetical protein
MFMGLKILKIFKGNYKEIKTSLIIVRLWLVLEVVHLEELSYRMSKKLISLKNLLKIIMRSNNILII